MHRICFEYEKSRRETDALPESHPGPNSEDPGFGSDLPQPVGVCCTEQGRWATACIRPT